MKNGTVRLTSGAVKHPPLSAALRDDILVIQAVFQEHYSLSVEAWEEGFRRDATPEREIALWFRAAEIYRALAADDPSAARRREIYRCLVICMVVPPEAFSSAFRPEAIAFDEASQIATLYYGREV